MNSETPLTDAEAYDYTPARTEADEFYGNTPEAREVVNADFARRLELRNRRLVEALRKVTDRLPVYEFQGFWSIVVDYDDVKMIRTALTNQQETKP